MGQKNVFQKLLMDKFPDVLTKEQRECKILPLLSVLKRQDKVKTDLTIRGPVTRA